MIVFVPVRRGAVPVAAPAPAPAAAPDLREAQDATKRNIAETRAVFSRLGVSEREGNGPVRAIIEPDLGDGQHFHNAAYMRGHDTLLIGHVPQGKSYAHAKDVIAHEFSHRVVDTIAGLTNFGESGVVNESLADTFAAVVDKDDWTIGEDVTPGGMRSMSNPGYKPNSLGFRPPAHLDEKVRTLIDKGGVHLNVGIPNKAAAIVGDQLGRERMGEIYLNAVRNHLEAEPVREGPLGVTNFTNIASLAQATIQSANELGSRQEVQAVRDAWKAVGFDDRTIARGVERLPEMAANSEEIIRRLEAAQQLERYYRQQWS